MLGLDHNPVISATQPQSQLVPMSEAPPLPTGSLHAEPVPAAQKDQPVPMVRILIPVIMVVAIGAVTALMMLSGRGVSPMMLILSLIHI